MDSDTVVEQQILAEIERLRAQFPETQDLYREACALLFFRFGVTPTANKLYQFVRKGSMSAPAQALNKFWSDLREKSRVRIEHPDIPDELREIAGELLAGLWNKARVGADEGLAVFRHEAQTAILEAKQAQANAEAMRDAAQNERTQTLELLRVTSERVSTLEQQLAAENATRSALESHIQQTSLELTRLQQAQEDARREFSVELEKQRSASQLVEDRFRAAEERALVEIDRERTASIRLRKELDQVRTEAIAVIERHQAAGLSMQTEMGQLQQRSGILEGSLQAAISERDRIAAQAEELRIQLTAAFSTIAGLRAESDGWRSRVQETQQAMDELRAKTIRRTKKHVPNQQG